MPTAGLKPLVAGGAAAWELVASEVAARPKPFEGVCGAMAASFWAVSTSWSLVVVVSSMGFKVSCILRSNCSNSSLRVFRSSSFFHALSTISLSMGMSFCNVSFSDLYFSNKRGIVSRALMKFRAAVLGSVAKAP